GRGHRDAPARTRARVGGRAGRYRGGPGALSRRWSGSGALVSERRRPACRARQLVAAAGAVSERLRTWRRHVNDVAAEARGLLKARRRERLGEQFGDIRLALPGDQRLQRLAGPGAVERSPDAQVVGDAFLVDIAQVVRANG